MALNPNRFTLIALVTAGHVNMATVEKGPIVPLGNPRVIGIIYVNRFRLPYFCGKSQVCRISRPLTGAKLGCEVGEKPLQGSLRQYHPRAAQLGGYLTQCVTNEDNYHIIGQCVADVHCMKRLASSFKFICTQSVPKCCLQKVQIRSNLAESFVSSAAGTTLCIVW